MSKKLMIIYKDNTKSMPVEVWLDNKLVWDDGYFEMKWKDIEVVKNESPKTHSKKQNDDFTRENNRPTEHNSQESSSETPNKKQNLDTSNQIKQDLDKDYEK